MQVHVGPVYKHTKAYTHTSNHMHTRIDTHACIRSHPHHPFTKNASTNTNSEDSQQTDRRHLDSG